MLPGWTDCWVGISSEADTTAKETRDRKENRMLCKLEHSTLNFEQNE